MISFPFRLTPLGAVATTEPGSDQEVNEAIAVLILTRPGEHHLAPEYGVPDPTWAGLQVGDVQVGLDDYGPTGVTVTSITSEPVTGSRVTATVNWDRPTPDDMGAPSE